MKQKAAVSGEKWKKSGVKVKKQHPTAGQFAVAFVLTLCLFGLFLSFFLIECNIRQTVYGKVELPVGFQLEEGLPVLTRLPRGEPMGEVPDCVQQAAFALLPGGQRLTAALIRGETALAAWGWEWVTRQMERIKNGEITPDVFFPKGHIF